MSNKLRIINSLFTCILFEDIPKTTTFAPSKPKQKRLIKYKLLILDLDGTLTNAKKEITLRNHEALIHVQKQIVFFDFTK
ncbi:hypothetical protein M074_0224 [Bacteroides fragilis str. DS-166]|nr:hypothetical protein M074_0224 [Bacteroides fragilis str. DS-166]